MRKILVPMDNSPLARTILPHVEELAGCIGAKIILLGVGKEPKGYAGPSYHAVSEEVHNAFPASPVDVNMAKHPIYESQEMASAEARIRDALLEVEENLQNKGLETETVILFGDPAGQIIDYAHREKVYLVAMATRVRHGLERLIQGSVARRVVAGLTIPVLLLPITEERLSSLAEVRHPFEEL